MNALVNHGTLGAKAAVEQRPERRAVHLPGFAIVDGKRTVEVTLLNLTYDGCCVEVAKALEPGQTVKLSVPEFGSVEAHVRWCNGREAGLAFGPIAEPKRQRRTRAAERMAVDAEVLQRRQGQPNYRVRLFDVSRTGCKAEFVERPRVGDQVWIKFDGLESLNAEVCWAEGFQAGLRYANPIHPAVFDLLIKRFGA